MTGTSALSQVASRPRAGRCLGTIRSEAGCRLKTNWKWGIQMTKYIRFALMIATSTIVMFAVMYLNSYDVVGHAFWSETRAYMSLLMAATMIVVMLTFMLGMYRNRNLNLGLYGFAVVLFVAALALVRSQVTVDDVDYMEAMIPHHSIAILTSKRAKITDPRVRQLADDIIAAQEREIAEMRTLIADLSAAE